jgi:hypothetical protein
MVNVMFERKRKRDSFRLYQWGLFGASLFLLFAPAALDGKRQQNPRHENLKELERFYQMAIDREKK